MTGRLDLFFLIQFYSHFVIKRKYCRIPHNALPENEV